jgi:hypothetical protein
VSGGGDEGNPEGVEEVTAGDGEEQKILEVMNNYLQLLNFSKLYLCDWI